MLNACAGHPELEIRMTRKRGGVSARERPEKPVLLSGASRVVERADGYHWMALDGRQEFGPFQTHAEALSDMSASDELALAPQSVLHEVEKEIGIADWIDPETGEPAEGGCPPRLDEE